MIFNSLHFAVFFVTVFVTYWAVLRKARPRKVLLLLASYYFYMSWNWKYAGLILASTVLDYFVGLALGKYERPGVRKLLVTASLVGNLGMLATFKYFNFFAESFADLMGAIGWPVGHVELHVLLPVGISFYTFQTLSYTLDVYRGSLQPTRSFLDFSVFVAFFPQLVAGPIVRASTFLPQLQEGVRFDDDVASRSLARMFRGLFKKILIADTLAVAIVDPVYADPGSHSGLMNLLATYAYAFQIYCDFSGYSDVAIGAAGMLGFTLPENFNRPYRALGVRDFWARWHISLSTWLRDYLYISLGGNRKGRWKTYRNLALTMLLGGLWHGAAWNFVFWGALHGVWLIAARAVGSDPQAGRISATQRWLRRLGTFHIVCLSWVLFRARSAGDVFTVLRQILTWAPGPLQAGYHVWVPLAMGVGLHLLPRVLIDRGEERFGRLPSLLQGTAYFVLLVIFVAASGVQVPFIYFQF